MPQIPAPVKDKLAELEKLVENYPLYLPVEETARFLHMDAENLKANIDMGRCPFALGWQRNIKGNRAYKIPTPTFYIWYTGGATLREA